MMHFPTANVLRSLPLTACLAWLAFLPGRAQAQQAEFSEVFRATHIIIPQAHGFPIRPNVANVVIESVQAQVQINDGAASTTLQIALRNMGSTPAEAVLLLPVPDDAAVGTFLFEGQTAEPTAQIMRRDEARRLYEQIVARVRDPALLEFAGYNLIRSSVFPVPAGGTQKVRLTYENILPADGNRIDYVLPRSESLDRRVPWRIAVDLQAGHPISTVYSPSHDLVTERRSEKRILVHLADSSPMAPGPFLLSYLLERSGVSASIFAYPDPATGGGYFLLMAGLPASIADNPAQVKREVTIVIDRSGSMAGEKMDQVRAAASQVIEGLADGETFNIIDYSTTVSSLARQPVIKGRQSLLEARAYLQAMRPGGGTNIHDALVEALIQQPTAGMMPIVLFLTDGLPTVGQTSETAIRDVIEKGNPHQRRVFTFGVGSDVNVPLLDRLADVTRATATYVLPKEDVEVKVSQVFRRLYGPVLANPSLDDTGELRLITDIMPVTLPDVFAGDQFVVLGRYRNTGRPMKLQLAGTYLGEPKQFEFTFDPSMATTRHAFVPRLWASRRIAYLVDLIRQAGAETPGKPTPVGESFFNDPRFRELADEILRLSTQFGILTEYTSFLATEGTNLNDWNTLREACGDSLNSRAIKSRSGEAAVNQGVNFNAQKGQALLNYSNIYVDEKMQSVQTEAVQQVCDRAFFKRGNQWIDGQLVNAQNDAITTDAVVEYGSPEHLRILQQLVTENRQGVLSLNGDIIIRFEGRNILVRNTAAP